MAPHSGGVQGAPANNSAPVPNSPFLPHNGPFLRPAFNGPLASNYSFNYSFPNLHNRGAPWQHLRHTQLHKMVHLPPLSQVLLPTRMASFFVLRHSMDLLPQATGFHNQTPI